MSGIGFGSLTNAAEFKLTASDGAADDCFGDWVDISSDYAIVGSRYDDDNGTDAGSAYIFIRNGTYWSQQAKLLAYNGESDDWFGNGVAIFGDYIIVGARNNDQNGMDSGSAYIFHFNGTSWTQQARLAANDGTAGDLFGNCVDISDDYAILGAYYDDNSNGTDAGAVYMFHRSGTDWNQQTKLIASGGTGHDTFGGKVSISGDYSIIGAHLDDDNGTNSGSAYIFHYNGSSWSQQAKFVADDAAADDLFGTSVSISDDYAIVGARKNDDNGIDSGSAYIFHRDGTIWSQQAKLIPNDGSPGDEFGCNVSISGDNVLVGTWCDDDNGTDSGSAYIFHRDGENWNQKAKLLLSDGSSGGQFGWSVAISNDYVIVGAATKDDNAINSGSAYIFSDFAAEESDSWQLHLTASVNSTNDLDNYAGVAAKATDGFDSDFDLLESAPPPSNYVQLYFPHPEWNHFLGDNFTHDIRAQADLSDTIMTWDFNVDTDQSGSTIALVITPEDVTPGFGLKLTDLDGGVVQNLKSDATFDFTAVSARKFKLIVGDSTAPVLTLTSPNGGEVLSSTTYNITWNVSDGTGVESISLYYSIDNGESYIPIATLGGDQTQYTWTVPELCTYLGLVKITATDSMWNTAQDVSDSLFTISAWEQLNTYAAGWKLMSVPLVPDNKLADALIGDDVVNYYYLFDYTAATGYFSTDTVTNSKGYWLASEDVVNLDVQGTTVTDTKIISLAAG